MALRHILDEGESIPLKLMVLYTSPGRELKLGCHSGVYTLTGAHALLMHHLFLSIVSIKQISLTHPSPTFDIIKRA